jgi:hypothetical protein
MKDARSKLIPGSLWQRRCNGTVCRLDEAPKVRFGVETVWLYRTDGRNVVYHLPVKTVLRRWEYVGQRVNGKNVWEDTGPLPDPVNMANLPLPKPRKPRKPFVVQ